MIKLLTLHTEIRPIWKINIDTGGTFTDCLATDPEGTRFRIKVLSSARLRGCIVRKVSRLVFEFSASWQFQDGLLDGYVFQVGDKTATLVSLDYSTRLLTINADLDSGADFELYTGEEAPILAARLLTKTRLGEALPAIDMRLGTTKGTNALLERKGAKTLLVVTKGFKDLLYIGNQQRPSLFQLDIPEPRLLYADVFEVDERLSADGQVVRELDLQHLRESLKSDFESVAISLLHAYSNQENETAIAGFFDQNGVKYISASADLFPFSHYLRRTQTAVVNAYLDPVLDVYLSNIKKSLGDGKLSIMTSTGSLSEPLGFRAKDSLLSGPAGGIVAAANAAKRFGLSRVLTFDMGGTSTDVAKIDGEPELKYVTEIDGIEFHTPALAIETVAAGGGSVCWFDGYSLQVGPASAGSSPGPACYGAGGPLTITDVNLLLGKLDPAKFGIPVHPDAAAKVLEGLRSQIFEQTGNLLSCVEILEGLERITNEKMADAIRTISVKRGINPAEFALITFGGAGGLHSCQLADLLEIEQVIIPYDAGLFSAVGIGEALISTIVTKQVMMPWTEAALVLDHMMNNLWQQAQGELREQGIFENEISFFSAFLRFEGQENTIEVNCDRATALDDFKAQYLSQFGYYPEGVTIELESIKLKVQEKRADSVSENILMEGKPAVALRELRSVFQTDDHHSGSEIYDWDLLSAGDEIPGPSILLNNTSTAYIPRGWKIVIQRNRDAFAFKTSCHHPMSQAYSEEVALQLFTNRFKAIADDMGLQLQRTAFSVNVKERLDFSCALLDPDGALLVNAQHIPVHLGSMGICGRMVRDAIEIGPGDVIITNHPKYGGSHLPDITLLSGVYSEEGILLGYVINRAHHAEIGGKTPGSMPPDATCLIEEGVVILPQYLVRKGAFQWETLHELFTSGLYPTRHFRSNEADILAALSSLRKGSARLLGLVDSHGRDEVRKYMNLLKASAASQLENALMPWHGKTVTATELLDDDHRIEVAISISENRQIFDFTGTSQAHPHNLNANISILYSAILYVLRLLVGRDIPLNDGLMAHVDIVLPDNSFLHPDFSDDPLKCPAVVGGNTEVSQRLVDTLLKAFGLSACSQGTMNNFLFGNKHFGYYETIGGGAGAGPGFHGRSAVHQHMTNTRITDPEQLECKYPVRLVEFGIRKHSGGSGKFHGGDGIIRKIQFLQPLQVTLLGQHRKHFPYGLDGGEHGKCGEHILISGGLTTRLPGIISLEVSAGDVLIIRTPGGGGYGKDQV